MPHKLLRVVNFRKGVIVPGQSSLNDILIRLAAAGFAGSVVAGVALESARQMVHNALHRPAVESLFDFVFSDNRATVGMRLTCLSAGALVFAIVLITSFRARSTKTLMILLSMHAFTAAFAIAAAGAMTAFDVAFDHH